MSGLTHARYGKDKIRVFRVVREGKWHHVVEYNVCALLEGNIDVSYTQADNSVVVATDSIKNITYYLAKTSPHILHPERFALHLGSFLVHKYAHIHKAFVTIEKLRWQRIAVDGTAHPHAFFRDGEDVRVTSVEIDGTQGKDQLVAKVSSGMQGLLVLKSTGSGFENFIRDEFTTLIEVPDRIFSTSIDLTYTYAPFPVTFTGGNDGEVKVAQAGEGTAWAGEDVATFARKVTLEVFAVDESASVQWVDLRSNLKRGKMMSQVEYDRMTTSLSLSAPLSRPPWRAITNVPYAIPHSPAHSMSLATCVLVSVSVKSTAAADNQSSSLVVPDTGDRPYKCQHCGDQFARSDLLSRHVNKCHAAEKPPITTAPSRRKGPTAASRATTSKQACDQCVQSSLPCDGCNPCSKCVSRKCRCTYVKFHRQTAPQGPGHPPPSQLLQHNSHSALASIPTSHPSLSPLTSTPYGHMQYPLSYSQQYPNAVQGHSRTSSTSSQTGSSTRIPGIPDEFLLSAPNHAQGNSNLAALGLSVSAPYQSGVGLMEYPGYPGYTSDPQRESPTPSLTASTSTASTTSMDNMSGSDMMARYQAQVDLLNRSGMNNVNVPVSSTMNLHMMQQGLYEPQQQQQQQHGATVGGSQREAWGRQSFHDHPAKDDSTAGPGERGIPFPTHSSAHNPASAAADHHEADVRASSASRDRGEGFSSAFGLMSLDDPAVLAGLANDGEPFFSAVRGHNDGSPDGRDIHMDANQHQHHSDGSSDASGKTIGSHASSNTSLSSFTSMNFNGSSGTTPLATKEELKEFWRQYMRTPLTGPGSASNGMLGSLATPLASGSHLQLGHGQEGDPSTSPQRPGFGSPSRRHSRVASLPSMKTPGVANEWNLFAHGSNNQGQTNGSSSGNHPNAELGFNAVPQHPPFHLTLNPRHGRNRDAAASSATHPPLAPPPPKVNHGNHTEDLKSYEQAVLARKAPTQLNLVPRRRGTIHLGAIPSLTAAQLQQQQQQQGQTQQQIGQQQAKQARAAQVQQQMRIEAEGSSLSGAFDEDEGLDGLRRDADSPTPSGLHDAQHMPFGHNNNNNMSPPSSSSVPAQTQATHSASASPELGHVAYRPSFKRLASQTLVPEHAKRASLGPAGWDEPEEEESSGGSGGSPSEFDPEEYGGSGLQAGGAGARWAARRMSLPSHGRSGVGVGSPVL
ncbi:hypothetical protein EUX98_g2965 [Antrodiella citrinella]|uniref:factor independent urate hydroxylase n=1 Tax=Antrodiella citrinella TaxID=2447956 RepID=A0A4S4MXM8_9APHY|nr:hypothetical protein EUX98_g2965 [Antrodiella citrinella]